MTQKKSTHRLTTVYFAKNDLEIMKARSMFLSLKFDTFIFRIFSSLLPCWTSEALGAKVIWLLFKDTNLPTSQPSEPSKISRTSRTPQSFRTSRTYQTSQIFQTSQTSGTSFVYGWSLIQSIWSIQVFNVSDLSNPSCCWSWSAPSCLFNLFYLSKHRIKIASILFPCFIERAFYLEV